VKNCALCSSLLFSEHYIFTVEIHLTSFSLTRAVLLWVLNLTIRSIWIYE